MKLDWSQSPARRLVAQARRVEDEVPAAAEVRVWRGLRRRREREGRSVAWRMFFAGAGCAACLACAFLVVRMSGERIATQIADGARIDLRPGEALKPTPGASVVEVKGIARLVAGPGSRAVIDRALGGGVQVRVEGGTLLAHVTPRPARAPFLVVTPRFTARVVGTVLRVAVAPDGESSIAVGHGAVEVTPTGGAPVMVRSGERWPKQGSRALLATELSADEVSSELARLGDAEGVTAASFAALAPIATPASAVPAPAAPPVRCAGAPEEAIRCDLEVAATADAVRAESALYDAGFIAWQRRHDGPLALAIWQRQRTRFPHGLLRTEAQTSIVDALVAAHRSREAAGEIEHLLDSDPGTLRASEMRFVLGTLYHELDGNCRRAAPELAAALRHPGSSWATRARAASAACRR